ncbi:MAG: shikimate dehydrogenase [Bacteroidales bacterium]|jgi:shikimate dehydrogenase
MQNHSQGFGLIGFPLGHSFSKAHFSKKFEQEGLSGYHYDNFEIGQISLLGNIIREHTDLSGLNVTIPYKQSVMGYLDEMDPEALQIGAVNTIKIMRTNDKFWLKGFNTDSIGFINSLDIWKLTNNCKALVFGTGGSSLAITFALARLGIPFIRVTRQSTAGFMTYGELTEQTALDHNLWINCTPVGMYPATGEKLPLPYHVLTPGHFLFDLVYNPELTEFLNMGSKAGASLMNGSKMLFEQAEASWRIWTGKTT